MTNQTEVTTQVIPEAFKQVSQTIFHGTVQDFCKHNLKVNGAAIGPTELSVFGRYKMFPVVGERKPARGRSAAIYEIDFEKNPQFSL